MVSVPPLVVGSPFKYMVVPTVKDRIPFLGTFLDSIARYTPDWQVFIVAQEFTKREAEDAAARLPGAAVLTYPTRIGMHGARVAALRAIEAGSTQPYVVCTTDDDMEFTERTNLEPCVSKACEEGVGLVSSNWAKSYEAVMRKEVVDEFVRQPIVYTGGGMVFHQAVARVICEIPDGDYWSDNMMWALATYVAGYQNYRYRGSIAVHLACRSGGRKAWCALEERELAPSDLLPTARGKTQLLISGSKDLTPAARRMHLENRRSLSGGPHG